MAKIITDTTIWYDNKHNRPRWEKMFTATYLNFYELAHSKNMVDLKKQARWINAITNLAKVPYDFIYSTPNDFMLCNGNDDSENKGYNDLLPIFTIFSNAIQDNGISFVAGANEWIKEKNKFYVAYHNSMQTLIAKSRREFLHHPENFVTVTEMIELFREKFCSSLLNPSIDHKKVDWSEFELLENVGAHFFGELVTNTKIGWQINDYDDLFNLLYVSPRDQYYVIEPKWIALIQNAGMGKYLFKPNH